MARIYGYSRTADYEQTPSLERQQELVEWKAAEIEGVWQGYRMDHSAGSWTDRPEFKALLEDLEAGDHLVVYDLRRLDSKQENAIEAAQALVDRQVHLHVLNMRGLKLDLDPDAGRAYLELWRWILAYFAQSRREAIRDALQYRKQIGLAYSRHPGFGKKRVLHNGLKMDMWNERQCCLIREIKYRHDAGESIYSIARDFIRRRERTGSGKLWANFYGKGRRVNANRLYRACKWYSSLLASGKDLWGITRKYVAEEFEAQQL